MKDTRHLITLDWEHVISWALVIILLVMTLVGFTSAITEPEKFGKNDASTLLMWTMILLIAVYALGYLR